MIRITYASRYLSNYAFQMCVILKNKKMILKLQYLKLPIDAYRVIANFEVSEIYLIDPAKEIFRKFPKMDILNFFLILPLDIYLLEFTQLTKTSVLGLV